MYQNISNYYILASANFVNSNMTWKNEQSFEWVWVDKESTVWSHFEA